MKDNYFCEKINRQISYITSVVKEILNSEDICEQIIDEHLNPDIYLVAKDIDWYCNNQHPEGRRIVKNKSRILRKVISKEIPCMIISRFTKKYCDSCEIRFKCWSTKNRNHIFNVINNATKAEMKKMHSKKMYEDTISENDFNERKMELLKCLGIKE